ncbi:MAG: DNA polymerase IV [Deltaproteobacteria bacterium]|nr:MAG: DNA polymerase IV [Deltaproteobacteria bacterium]
MRWFFHVDMDAFFASVEQALDPALKGKPVIVDGRNGRGVVTSASYEARKYGVHAAMPGFQAKKLCPQATFLPNRRRVYSEFSKKIFAILEQYSPEIHAISIDEGVVDLTGTEKLFGPPVNTAQKILKCIRTDLGLPASGGLSSNRVVAKIAATLAKPNGFLHIPFGSEEAFLSPLPVESIPGVGPKTHKELVRRGVKTIGDLLSNPELGHRFLDLDEGGQEKRRHDHSIGNETTLDAPLKERDEMEKVLWELVEEVGSRLRKERFYARCITVKIRYTNFKTITRSRTLLSPTCFDREIFEVVRDLLRKNLTPGSMVRLLGVSASSLLTSGWQESIFDLQKRRSWENLYRGIDRLRRKYGEEAIGTATPHIRSR